jgi:uncharacterized protein (TIGR03086 family)
MDDLAALRCATEEFRRRLDAIGPDQWHRPTPCDDWDLTMLVEHVAGGNRMGELLLHGADAKASIDGARSVIGSDLVASFEETSADQVAAFAEDGALERTVHHIVMDMPGSMLLMFRTTDLTVHAWDLAKSIGADANVDPDLVTSIWNRLEPIAPLLSAGGMFRVPPGVLPDGASIQDTLLHATGRNPGHS